MSIILKVCSGGRCKDVVFACIRNDEFFYCDRCWLSKPTFKNCPWSNFGGKKRSPLPQDKEGTN